MPELLTGVWQNGGRSAKNKLWCFLFGLVLCGATVLSNPPCTSAFPLFKTKTTHSYILALPVHVVSKFFVLKKH
jgi:hypothetical protein